MGRSWYIDETYIKVGGRWRYLYRAIDRTGALVDVRFSEHRDMKAARAFFRSAKAVTGIADSYPRAIRTELGRGVRHGHLSPLEAPMELAAAISKTLYDIRGKAGVRN